MTTARLEGRASSQAKHPRTALPLRWHQFKALAPAFHHGDFLRRQAVKLIDGGVNLAVEALNLRFQRREVGAAGFPGDSLHCLADHAQVVPRAGGEMDQRLHQVDHQGINLLRLLAFGPFLLTGVFLQEAPPAGIDKLAQ